MLHPQTQSQIDRLNFDRNPLIVCDVDEVVVSFVTALEAYLDRHGYWLDARSFALTGNIKRVGDNEPATQTQVGEFLHGFFATDTASLQAIPGAVAALQELSALSQIVLLTNMPHAARAARIANLSGHGISLPLITNTGAKGPAVAELSRRAGKPVFFLDDAPTNVTSVLELDHDDLHVIHFIGDERFAALLEPIEGTRLRTSYWTEARTYILSVLNGDG